MNVENQQGRKKKERKIIYAQAVDTRTPPNAPTLMNMRVSAHTHTHTVQETYTVRSEFSPAHAHTHFFFFFVFRIFRT